MPTSKSLAPDSTILFIGDSITDGDRSRTGDPNHPHGDTYVRLIAARHGTDHPNASTEYINRGINGDRITDLAARWEEDCLLIQPDLLSIYVGVNDAASVVEQTNPPAPRKDGKQPKSLVSQELFRETYEHLLTLTRQRLPQVNIILVAPFVLPVGKIGEHWEIWQREVNTFALIVDELSHRHQTNCLHLQPLFDAALEKASASHWAPDGVHPSAAGHQLIADAWNDLINQPI